MAAWAPCPPSATKREITWRGSSLASAYCTHVGPEARCPRQRGFRGRAAPPRRLRTNKTAAIARHLKRAHRVSQCCKPHQIRHACVRQGLRAASFAQNIRFAAPEENLHVLIWYVFLICHALFCHALFCHAMFSYVFVMLCSVVLCFVQFCHVRQRGGWRDNRGQSGQLGVWRPRYAGWEWPGGLSLKSNDPNLSGGEQF